MSEAESVRRGGWLRPALFLVIVVLTFPAGLFPLGARFDQEWSAALNELAARDERVGQDIAFSYGPLGPILLPMDRGSVLIWSLPAHFLLSLAWWGATRLLLRGIRDGWDAAFFAVGMVASQLIGAYAANVLPFGVLAWLAVAYRDREPRAGLAAGVLVAVALLAKFSTGIAVAATMVVWGLLTLARDRKVATLGWLALTGLASATTFAALWGLLGNDPVAIPRFFRDGLLITSGYSSQLSRVEQPWMEWLPLPFALLYLGGLWLAWRRRDPALPMLLLIGMPLFFLYRWYILRVDGYRLLSTAFQVAGLAGFPLAVAGSPGLRSGLRLVAFATAGLGAWGTALALGIEPFLAGPRGMTAAFDPSGIRDRVAAISRAATESSRLPESAARELDTETVDAFGSADYLPVLLHKLNWRPRPVLQSILTCHPELDRRCAAFFAGGDAPHFVLYPHERFDKNYPAFLDTTTWLELYRWYDLRSTAGERLILVRRPAPRWAALREIGRTRARLGEPIAVPRDAGGIVIGRPRLALTPAGRLKMAIYKVLPPQVRVTYDEGEGLVAPLFWQNAAEGMMASHLPRSLMETAELFGTEPDETVAAESRVRTLAVEADASAFAPEVEWTWLAVQE